MIENEKKKTSTSDIEILLKDKIPASTFFVIDSCCYSSTRAEHISSTRNKLDKWNIVHFCVSMHDQ